MIIFFVKLKYFFMKMVKAEITFLKDGKFKRLGIFGPAILSRPPAKSPPD